MTGLLYALTSMSWEKKNKNKKRKETYGGAEALGRLSVDARADGF